MNTTQGELPRSPHFRIAITKSRDVEGQLIWAARIHWGETLASHEDRFTTAEGFPTRRLALAWANSKVMDRMGL